MSIEAMKLALEALEFYYDQHGEEKDGQAITALRQAIEQEQKKPCIKGGQCKHGSWCSEVYCQEHCEFVEQAQKQEPVGEVQNEQGDVDWISFVPAVGTSLYTTPPQRQPPPFAQGDKHEHFY